MAKQLEFSIFENEGMVVIGFSELTQELCFTPEVGRGIAEEIARKSHHAQFKNLPVNSNSLIEQKRTKLLRRVELVLNNLDKRKIKRTTIAAQVIDIILAEVL